MIIIIIINFLMMFSLHFSFLLLYKITNVNFLTDLLTRFRDHSLLITSEIYKLEK